jgi:outer membrane receptor protein involved in Fe transport
VDCTAHPSAPSCNQEVVVTGSRIKRADLGSIQPIGTIGSEEIKERGITNLADAVNELPATGPGVTPIGNQNSFGVGHNYIDLLGLGSNRTLTLVNGQRFVGDNASNFFGIEGGNQVDLNTLPTLFVDHIDTVVATGAAVYGSDAISGVVNIVMKKRYVGAEVSTSYGFSDYDGDAPHYNVEAAVGHDFLDGKLNVAIDFQFDRTNSLSYADRPYTAAEYGFVPNPNNPSQSILVPNTRFSGVTAGGLPFQLDGQTPIYLPNPSGGLSNTLAQFGPNGNLVPFNPGIIYNYLIGGTSGGGDSLNEAPLTSLQTPLTRKVGDFIASYDITPHVHFSTNIIYSEAQAIEEDNQPNYSALAFGGASAYNNIQPGQAILISAQNAFLTPQAQSALAANGAGDFYLSRANTDIATAPINSYVHTFNADATLNGDFNALHRTFDWSLSYEHGASWSDYVQSNLVFGNPAYGVADRFGYALDSIIGANGQPQCRVTALNPGSTNPDIANCVPFNPFGVNNNSKAALNYVTAPFGDKALNSQDDIVANISTTLFKLPAGDLRFSAGFEYRRNKDSFTPDAASAEGIGYSVPIDASLAAYDTREYFTEVVAPILGPGFNFPFAYKFELEGAYRKVNNSIAGNNESWSYGGRFSPIPDITLRGSRSETFRAPSLQELFSPQTSLYDDGADPCEADNINAGPNPKVRAANCAAAFAALGANLQSFTSSDVSLFTLQGTGGGNAQLKNEIGQNYTYGLQLQPRFLPGLTASMDYVVVDVSNAIEFFGIGNYLEECYDSPSYPSQYCDHFQREPGTGQIVNGSILDGFVNAGFEHYTAMMYSVVYDRRIDQLPFIHQLPFVPEATDLGRIGLDFSATNIRSEVVSVSGLGFDSINYAGTVGTPRWRWRATASYRYGPFYLGWTAHYIGPSAYDLTYTPADREPLTVHQSVTHDLALSYDITKKMVVHFNVNNVFNQPPPLGADTVIGNYYDFIGRYYIVGLDAKF